MASHRYRDWQEELEELDVVGDVSTQGILPTAQEIKDACVAEPYFIRISDEHAQNLKYKNDRLASPQTAQRIAGDIWFAAEQVDGEEPWLNDIDFDRSNIPDALED